jgi:hypothetical protein
MSHFRVRVKAVLLYQSGTETVFCCDCKNECWCLNNAREIGSKCRLRPWKEGRLCNTKSVYRETSTPAQGAVPPRNENRHPDGQSGTPPHRSIGQFPQSLARLQPPNIHTFLPLNACNGQKHPAELEGGTNTVLALVLSRAGAAHCSVPCLPPPHHITKRIL